MTHPLALVARYFARRAVTYAGRSHASDPVERPLAESAFCADDAAYFADRAARERDWSQLYVRTRDARHCAADARRRRITLDRTERTSPPGVTLL